MRKERVRGSDDCISVVVVDKAWVQPVRSKIAKVAKYAGGLICVWVCESGGTVDEVSS